MNDFSTRIATRKKHARNIFGLKLLDPTIRVNRFPAPKHHESAARHWLDAIAPSVHDAEARSDKLPLGIVGCVRHRRGDVFRASSLCAAALSRTGKSSTRRSTI
jgi:hypothetical protein